MKNTFGNNVSVTLYGESHGPVVGAVLDGLAPGIPVDEAFIRTKMERRRPVGNTSTARRETDRVTILSGVYEGHTTGTPLCLQIENADVQSRDYAATRFIARPGHADLTAFYKYHGFEDPRGGGHFSGRLTAPLVAAGAIVSFALEKKGIRIFSHIRRCAGIDDRAFSDLRKDASLLAGKTFAVLDDAAGEEMRVRILAAAADGDSVGGILETAVAGLPAGVGEPWFDSVEGVLSHILFSVPAVKGVEFGDGFAFADLRGSEANDPLRMADGNIVAITNRNGGVNGGITNGMPLLFRTVIKPTPSIYKKQETVDFLKHENAELAIQGRHDPAIIHRAAIVIDSVTAIALADLLTGRYGTDYLTELK